MANLSNATEQHNINITQSPATVQAIVDILSTIANLSKSVFINKPVMEVCILIFLHFKWNLTRCYLLLKLYWNWLLCNGVIFAVRYLYFYTTAILFIFIIYIC